MALDAPLNVASIDQSAYTLASAPVRLRAATGWRNTGIIHDPHASSRLMIVEESEDTLALAEEAIAALTASAAGLMWLLAARSESRK